MKTVADKRSQEARNPLLGNTIGVLLNRINSDATI